MRHTYTKYQTNKYATEETKLPEIRLQFGDKSITLFIREASTNPAKGKKS
jgi:hypothetical protein